MLMPLLKGIKTIPLDIEIEIKKLSAIEHSESESVE